MRNKKLLSVSMVFALLASFLLLFGASRPLPLTVQASQGASEPDFSLMFIENVGQFNEQARFRVDGGPGTLWLTGDALWLTISERSQVELSPEDMRAKFEERLPIAEPHQVVNMKLSFAGANPRPRLEPFNRLETTINYYLGNDPARWRTSVPVWGGMRYVDFYPGLDLEITSEGGQWAWRLVCREADCQASLREVRLQVAGVEGVELLSAPGGENGGGVRLNTALGNITLPLLTIEGGGPASQPASTRTTNGVFEIAAPFSAVVPGAKAAIQPSASAEVFFGTYLGGSDADKVLDIAIAGQGDILDGTRAIYVTGYTESSDFLVQPPGSSLLQGDMDVFVTKVRKVGATISPEYSTYIGGSYTNAAYQDKGAEKGYGIAVDENEAVYVTGSTRSDDFPTTSGAFDTTFNGEDPCGPFSPDRACSDAFILKLDSSGALAYSTYLGGTGTDRPGSSTRGSGDDTGTAIAVQNGDIYITGSTWAEDFPTTAGAYDQTFSHVDAGDNDDVFVVKLRPAGNGSADLLYSSFVGSASIERGYDIAVDGGGIVYVTGL
ncbi:MAG: SBBP repeat-containing protein, partial [Anaerolineales bacterium]